MMNRVKVFADDSVEAMAKITRELGGDARIYSTRQVNGGIEIIAGPPDDEEEMENERPARFNRASKKEEINFALLNILSEYGVSTAFPSTSVYFETPLTTTNIPLQKES